MFSSSAEANAYLRTFPAEETRIHPTAVLYGKTKIGFDVAIGPYSVIGKSGFGYDKDGKIPHIAGVMLCDNVEIGANTCIDRGKLVDTFIGKNTKIDNLVHIAHNVRIGKDCLVVAGAVIGGSCAIGDNCFIGMNVSIRQHLRIGDNVVIGAGAVVVKDLEPDQTYVGNPARPISKRHT